MTNTLSCCFRLCVVGGFPLSSSTFLVLTEKQIPNPSNSNFLLGDPLPRIIFLSDKLAKIMGQNYVDKMAKLCEKLNLFLMVLELGETTFVPWKK